MVGIEIDALAKRKFEFLFEKLDLRAGAPGAKDLARRQGRCNGACTVPDQAPAVGQILARETGILEKTPGRRAFSRTAEKARGIRFPTRRLLQQAIEQVSLVAKDGGIARVPSAELLETIASLLDKRLPPFHGAKRGASYRGQAAILREVELRRLAAQVGQHRMRARSPLQSARPVAGMQMELHLGDEIVADLVAEVGVDDRTNVPDFVVL